MTTKLFTKLFSSIVTSSIWNENDQTRIVWITMLSLSDWEGFVGASVGGLAHLARVSREACEKALNVLMSPDPDSRSPAHEGRRIEKVDRGYLILNYKEKGNLCKKIIRTEYLTQKKRESRARLGQQKVNNQSTIDSIYTSISISKENGESEGKEKARLEEIAIFCHSKGLTRKDAEWFYNKMLGSGWTNGGRAVKSWKGTIAAWEISGFFPSQKDKPKDKIKMLN